LQDFEHQRRRFCLKASQPFDQPSAIRRPDLIEDGNGGTETSRILPTKAAAILRLLAAYWCCLAKPNPQSAVFIGSLNLAPNDLTTAQHRCTAEVWTSGCARRGVDSRGEP
jgi:hypothetical protein